MSKDLKTEYRDWENAIESQLKKKPERNPSFDNSSGIEIKRIYTPLDIEGVSYQEDIGFPGEYPFTRGIQSTMYRGRLWSMRQYSGFGTAEESNKRFKYLLEQGQTGLSVAFDLPTQVGMDSDNELAEGEVGRVGVAIDSLEDMEILLKGIELDKVSTSMTINAPAAVLLAMYAAVAEKQGIGLDKLSGTIQNDVLKEYVARGTYIYPPKPSMRLTVDVIEYCIKNIPKWNFISVGGYHIREAGATAAQEMAFAFSNAIAYIEAAIEAGLEVDSFAPRISWIFNTYNNFFEEIAKYRAAKRLWARIMKQRFGAKNKNSCMLRMHIQDGGSTMTAQQPINNVIRSTAHCLASVFGGTQSLAICSYDEACAIPTEESARTSLRIQQIIAHETGVADTIDPLAGSYYVESLTNQLEKKIEEYIKTIDDLGGAIKAIESGYIQRQINDSSYRYHDEIEKGEKIVVGVNKYQIEEEPFSDIYRIDPSVYGLQLKKLQNLRGRRNNEQVQASLKQLQKAAAGQENIMPFIISAVKEYATLGEICDTLKAEFGRYIPSKDF